LFLPLFGLATGAQQATTKAGDSIVSRAELARQNELLHRENERLRLEAMRADEIARENDRLRKLFQWQQQHRWKSRLKLAHIVLRDPANWWHAVQIDLGSRDGLRSNLTVLTIDGLVGRVNSSRPDALAGCPRRRPELQSLRARGK
jgi:rod shape-determining protein MreC